MAEKEMQSADLSGSQMSLKLKMLPPPMLPRWCMVGGNKMRMAIGIAQTVVRLLLSATAAENELIASRTAPTAA